MNRILGLATAFAFLVTLGGSSSGVWHDEPARPAAQPVTAAFGAEVAGLAQTVDSASSAYINRLLRVARAAENYSGAVVNGQSVSLYGVAYPSAPVKKLIADAPSGTHVSWHRTVYTLQHLNSEADRLARKYSFITQLDIPENGSMLIVGTLRPDLLRSYHPGADLGTTVALKVVRRDPLVAQSQ